MRTTVRTTSPVIVGGVNECAWRVGSGAHARSGFRVPQLEPCFLVGVAAMIETLLRQCTDAEIEANNVDTHGASASELAFTELLGFRLVPRLRTVGSIQLDRPDDRAGDHAAYAHLRAVPITAKVDKVGLDNPANPHLSALGAARYPRAREWP